MGDARQVWKYSIVIEATVEDAEHVAEAIARTLCPDDDHAGACPVPWTMIRCRFEDLDDDERGAWEADFEEVRRTQGDEAED